MALFLETLFLQVITVLVILGIGFFLYVDQKYSYWRNMGVAFVEPKFPLGSLSGVGTKFHSSELFRKMYAKMKDSKPFFGLYLFFAPAVVVTDLDFIKTILVKDSQYFMDRGIYYNEKDDPISAHLFAIDDPKWSILRKKLSPTFTSGKMRMMFGTIADVGKKFVQTFDKEIQSSSEYEIKDILARFTTDIIGSCAFGINCNSLENPNVLFREMGRKAFDQSIFDTKSNFVMAFQNLSRFLKIKFVAPDVSAFFMNVIQESVDHRERNNIVRNDFLHLLIQMKNKGEIENDDQKTIYVGKLTIEEITAQAFVFFLAGFETSSTAISYALYELAMNHELQEKARKCVLDVLKEHNNEFTYEAVMQMDYIEQCLNEALRKYPPITNLTRRAKHDYKVPGKDGWMIKKGTIVFIPANAINNDPEYYPNPDLYDPDRFSREEHSKRNPFTFLSFGEGVRMCIGSRFGMLQAKIGLASLLANFKFDKCSKTPIPMKFLKHTFILTPSDGIYLNVQKL